MELNRQFEKLPVYAFNDAVKEIEDSGISSVCSTLNKFNRIMSANNMSSQNEDLEDLIKSDISFTFEVLKVANSPLYRSAQRQEVTDISNAIRQIGWDNIYKIGTTLTVKGLVKTSKASSFANWMVARATAIANISQTFLLALEATDKDLEKIHCIYTHGLTHDIGALGMLQIVEGYQQNVMEAKLKDTRLNWADSEQRVYGFNHNMLGEKILTDAGLPRDFSIVAKYHHAPNYIQHSSTNSKRIALIRLAQASLIDTRHFSEHEAFHNLSEKEEHGLIRSHDDFSTMVRAEFKEQLGLTAEIYTEIKETVLTDDYINSIYQQF